MTSTNLKRRLDALGILMAALISTATVHSASAGQVIDGPQADARNVKPVATSESKRYLGLYKESHALVIGVSIYDNFPELRGVAEDVTAVGEVLEQNGFQVERLRDPGRDELDRAIVSFIQRWGQNKRDVDNRLLIYFSGHGVTLNEKPRQLGYIVPKNAAPIKDEVAFRNTAISMDKFKEYAKPIEAKAVLFVFDCCFSGYMFEAMRNKGGLPPPIIWAKVGSPVRQFITAGTVEQEVPDKSIFRKRFVEALEGRADLDRDGYVTGSELCYFLESNVVRDSGNKETPMCGRSDEENGGDFVFKVGGPEPWPLSAQYVPTGWMGDGGGKAGMKFLSVTKEEATIGGKNRVSVRIEYRKGENGWAGVYWQHPRNNWGDDKGFDLRDAKAISFYVRGERGGEIVEFISGGIEAENKPHKDKFKKSLGEQALTQEWKQYTIDLTDVPPENRDDVVGAFAWVGSGGFDNSGRLVCHIADIQVVR